MKKLLISALVLTMGVTCAAALAACNNGGGKSDEELADEAIRGLKLSYDVTESSSKYQTPDDYTVMGQTNVDDNFINVSWSVSWANTTYDIDDYIVVGDMHPTTKLVTISVTRPPEAIVYQLHASVKVGDVIRDATFNRKVPEELKVEAGDEKFEFSSVTAHGTALNDNTALELFKSVGTATTGLLEVHVSSVYAGNGDGGGDYANSGGLLKLGTSSVNGTINLVFDKQVDRVVVVAQGWNSGTNTLAVNGSEAKELDTAVQYAYEFELDEPSYEVTIEMAKRGFIFEINAYYAEGVHNHVWSTTHNEGTWTHTKTCTAEGCDAEESTVTATCNPVNNVCSYCNYEYSESEILTALFALEAGKSLPGTLQLTGVITKIEEIQTGQFNNCTFWMHVGDEDVEVYRATGENYTTIEVGDTVTVSGTLTNYNGTHEFTSGGTITKIEKSGHTHHYTSKTHNEGTWTHTVVCDAADCTYENGTAIEDCTPELNVCSVCGHEYIESDILDALFALTSGKSLKGTYSLTGVVKAIKEPYSSYENVTVIITIGDKEVTVYRAKSDTANGTDYAATVKVTDTITVTGALTNYNGTFEFTTGCLIVDLVPGDGSEEPNPGGDELPDGAVSFDYSAQGYENQQTLEDVVITVEDATIVIAKGTGSTSPAYYTTGTAARAYHGNTVTVAVTAGHVITKITLNYTVSDGNEISVNVGTLAEGVWTGSAQSVVFTVGPKSSGANGGHMKLVSLTIEYTEGEGGEDGGDDNEHTTHDWSYTHVNGSWTHTATCTGCEEVLQATECSPVLNVCPDCKHEYTAEEIVEKLYTLSGNNTVYMNGTYQLTGQVTEITDAYTDQYQNITFTMIVAGKEVVAYRAKTELDTVDLSTIARGYIVTVTGTLCHYYNGTKEFTNTPMVTAIEVGELPEVETPTYSASLSFKDATARTSQDANSQVWANDGITFTNLKASSSNAVADYTNPVRCYAGSTINVEYTSAMSEIVFHCNNTTYAGDLKTSLEGVSGITVTVNGKDVTVVFETASDSIEFSAAKQLRFDSIDVKA